jgi:hypothetical protein
MGSSPDNFSELQSLLKLKRHEQPPPRFFDHLSHGVLDRLRGPEGLRQQTLFSVLGLDFGLKSILFYSLGVAGCLLAVSGLTYQLVKGPSPVVDPATAAGPLLNPPRDLAAPSPGVLAVETPPEGAGTSTNPVLSTEGVAFPIDPVKLKTKPASFGPKQ